MLTPRLDAAENLTRLLSHARDTFKTRPLRSALMSLVFNDMCIGSLFYLFGIVFTLANPVIIFIFLEWVPLASPSNWARGAILCVALGVANALCFLSEAEFAARMASAGLRARLGSAALVFRALSERREGAPIGAGTAHNLHGVDAAALAELPAALATLILQPLELGAIIAMLAYFVGAGAGGALLAVAACMAVVIGAGTQALKYDAARGDAADARIAVLSEFVSGARAAKLLGLEGQFASAITAARRAESALYASAARATALVHVAASNGVDIISLSLLLIYVLASPQAALTPAVTFTYWVLLATLHGRVFHFPPAAAAAREGFAALSRLESFLAMPKATDPRKVLSSSSLSSLRGGTLSLDSAALAWGGGAKMKPHTSPINAHITEGSLWLVLGPVGSGKTLFLSALLGEAVPITGTVSISPNTDFGYAPQSPFTLPASVRANIVLGREWDPNWYARVVSACALDVDFAAWPLGDSSSVSSTVLSGGQRARVAIARAVYGRPSVLVLDDTLASLDARVSAHIRRELLLGPDALCAKTTRIIATHSSGWLNDADGIIVLAHATTDSDNNTAPFIGHIFEGGAGIASLAARTAAMNNASLASALGDGNGNADDDDDDIQVVLVNKSKGKGDLAIETAAADAAAAAAENSAAAAATAAASAAPATSIDIDTPTNMNATVSTPPILRSLPFYLSWTSGVGGLWFASIILLLLFLEASWVEASVVVLAEWADDGMGIYWPVASYFGLYGATIVGELLSAFIRQRVYAEGTRRAADELHSATLARLANAPASVFSHAPGALLALFGRDLAIIDQQTWYSSEYWSLALLYSILVCAFQIAYTPWSIIAIIIPGAFWILMLQWRKAPKNPLLAPTSSLVVGVASDVCLDVDADADVTTATVIPPSSSPLSSFQGLSQSTLRALEATARVPLVTLVAIAVDAPAVTRAFVGLDFRLARAADRAADAHGATLAAASRADAASLLRANIIGVLYYMCQVAVIVPLAVLGGSAGVGGDRLTGGSAGLLVVNAAFASYMMQTLLSNAQVLNRLALLRGGIIRAATRLPQEVGGELPPTNLETLQRCVEGKSKQKNKREVEEETAVFHASRAALKVASALPLSWPSQGAISFKSVCLKYTRDGLRALDNATLIVPHGCFVAVVGRTGAGKSSLIAALARLVEIESGVITIDGIDVSALPLAVLRRAFVCITQDPLFFEGTLRRNLDPFNEYTDAMLLNALERVGLGKGLRGGGGDVDADAVEENADEVLVKCTTSSSSATTTTTNSVLSVHVSARGSNLSGGQAQLLALSRALLRKPTLLLLDEATAALSRGDEERVLKTVRSAFSGATVFAITHRLAGALGADLIAVVDGGKVVEFGSPKELLSKEDSFFGTLVDAAPGGEGVKLRARAMRE